MFLKNNALCAPQSTGLSACKLPGPEATEFFIDRAGPVDHFENPPVLVPGKGNEPSLLPYTHPSGLFAMMFMLASEPIDLARVRGARLHMGSAFDLYLAKPWKVQFYDPGKLPVQNYDGPEEGVVGYRVDAKNWSSARAIDLRSCSDALPVEFQVGPVRFAVPQAQVEAFQASTSSMSLSADRKAFTAGASCPGRPLYVGGFRVKLGNSTVEINGRGQNVQPQRAMEIDRVAKTGVCARTPEGPRLCEIRTPDAIQSVYSVEDSAFPVSVMCMTPKGESRRCTLAAEVELGFSYTVEMVEKPSASTNWAAEVNRMPDLIRALNPTPVPISSAKPAAGRAL